MHTGNARRIFCNNVTCFGTNKNCLNRSHLPNCFIKALHFLLAWLLCFFRENTSFFYFFEGGDIRNTPDCSGSNNSHFALENEGWKTTFPFLVWHPPWFFSFSGMVRRLLIVGMYQHKNSVHQARTSHLNKLGLTHRSNSLDVNTAKMPHMQEARKRLKKARSLCVACHLLTLFRNRKWLFGNPKYRPSSSCHALPADRRNKTLECCLVLLNASSGTTSHSLEQIQ